MLSALLLSGGDAFSPARYRSGAVPPVPAMAVGGGQVILDVDVDAAGRIATVTPLRTTPPFTELTIAAVRSWQFEPAHQAVKPPPDAHEERPARRPIASKVLVAAVFHRPAVLGPTLGEPPRDVGAVAPQLPFPTAIVEPPLPPFAYGSGVVLLEARLEPDGRLAETTVIRSAAPFDSASRTALAQWTFRPARVGGTPVPSFVYVMFGFPVPVDTTVRPPISREMQP